jgi:hypothetical protein
MSACGLKAVFLRDSHHVVEVPTANSMMVCEGRYEPCLPLAGAEAGSTFKAPPSGEVVFVLLTAQLIAVARTVGMELPIAMGSYRGLTSCIKEKAHAYSAGARTKILDGAQI